MKCSDQWTMFALLLQKQAEEMHDKAQTEHNGRHLDVGAIALLGAATEASRVAAALEKEGQ